ncbi:MAG: IS5 family transposase [Nitrosomonas sp.]|nr:IS5 family transposase [Nitrosomonas sp.]
MSHQTSFADLDYSHKKRRTRREIFLSQTEADTEFPSSSGEARIDGGIARSDQCSPQGPGATGFKGTMVDATLIHAPVRPRIENRRAIPEMRQTKKGKQWYFGMKVHVGADVDSGAVHTVEITAANEADISVLPKLLRAEDEVILGDAGYASDEYKRGSRQLGMRWCVQDKRKPGQNLSGSQKKRNRSHSSIRARVEHVFRVIKRQLDSPGPATVD